MRQTAITIMGSKLPLLFYKNRPVTTMAQIDELHKRPSKTANNTFRRNRKHFIKDRDFFEVDYSEWASLESRLIGLQNAFGPTKFVDSKNGKGGHRGKMYLFTETGYLMLVKPFADNLAWQVQRILVESYFSKRQAPAKLSEAEILSFRADILAGLTTSEVAMKHDRAASTIKKYTVQERKRMSSARQLMLPGMGLQP